MESPLKVIFAGTSEFALPCLQSLIDSEHQILAVYSQPDRRAGRGLHFKVSPIKQLAQTYPLSICQPETLKDKNEQDIIRAYQADLMVVVAYGLILPQQVLKAPRLGCINVHGSLLPRWRGAAPIQRAILAGDTYTGISVIQMDEGLDTGPILIEEQHEISQQDTSASLARDVAHLGAQLLMKAITQIAANGLNAKEQDNRFTTYAAKLSKDEACINWQENATIIARKIRAFYPWPIAYTCLGQTRIRVYQGVELQQTTHEQAGTIVALSPNGIDVATGEGMLRLEKIQLPGAKPLAVADILHAKKELFTIGTRFSP